MALTFNGLLSSIKKSGFGRAFYNMGKSSQYEELSKLCIINKNIKLYIHMIFTFLNKYTWEKTGKQTFKPWFLDHDIMNDFTSYLFIVFLIFSVFSATYVIF